MADTQASRKIDPELLRQLNAVAADNETVEAVVRLNPDNPAEIVPSPERTEELAREVLQRVAKRVGNPVMKHNVFSNLGSFVVSAPTKFVRELIEQPEVAAAVANRQAGEALIPPINKKPLVEKPQRKKPASKSPTRKKNSQASTKRTSRHSKAQ